MPEVEHRVETALPVGRLWAFVKDMDHWAHFLPGYQKHEVRSAEESIWTVRGDVGVLSREVRFRVRVTEWSGPARVAFDLEGLNEALRGAGEFALEDCGAGEGGAAPAAGAATGPLSRLLRAIARLLFRLRHGGVERAVAPPAAGAGASRMIFRLRVEAGGPMAPMVNAMLKPALPPAAEQLAERIVAHLEGRAGAAT